MLQQLNNLDHFDDVPPEIYVAYSEQDIDFALSIIEKIEGEGLKCYFKDRDEPTGQALENLCEESRNCRHVLLIYSKQSIKDGLIKILLIMSVQYTVEKKKLTLILLLHDIDKENLPKEVHFVPHVYTSDSNYFMKIMDKLRAPNVSMDHLLPVGNVAFGLVWGFYYGYLKLIMPEIPKRIDEWVQNHSSIATYFPRKLYIILPIYADFCSSLNEKDGDIHYVQTLQTLEIDRAGNSGRKYRNTIYRICKPDKEYHVVAEYATPLETMYKIKNGQLAGLTGSDLSNQVHLFKEKLSEILKHKDYPDNCCTLVIYDNEKSLSDVLVEAIENDLKKSEMEVANLKNIPKCLPTFKPGPDHPDGVPKIYVDYCKTDLNFAKDIVEKIENEGLLCYYKDRDESTGLYLENLCVESQSCRHVLLIYTKDSSRDALINFLLYQSLQHSAESEELTLIFLLHDIDKENFPKKLEFIHHVFTSEKNYFEIMMDKLRAPNVSMDHLIPVGNIACGLAWSFYYGYLKLIMPEIPNKIDKWVKENSSVTAYIPRRLYILLPTLANCYCSLSKVDDSIESLGPLPILETNRAGNRGRKYENTIYKICKPDKEYYVVAEYATPLKTMSEMEKGQLAGLTKSALIKEVHHFEEKMSEILKHKNCPDNCCTLIMCDSDNEESLSDLLVKAIENDLKEV